MESRLSFCSKSSRVKKEKDLFGFALWLGWEVLKKFHRRFEVFGEDNFCGLHCQKGFALGVRWIIKIFGSLHAKNIFRTCFQILILSFNIPLPSFSLPHLLQFHFLLELRLIFFKYLFIKFLLWDYSSQFCPFFISLLFSLILALPSFLSQSAFLLSCQIHYFIYLINSYFDLKSLCVLTLKMVFIFEFSILLRVIMMFYTMLREEIWLIENNVMGWSDFSYSKIK